MKRVVLASLVLILTCTHIWAQATAQIAGTVRDQSGAVLPGVEVKATQTDTDAVRNVVTNETGSYVLSNLPIGPYKLEATLPGFRAFVQTGIVLQVNASPVINAVLEVGQVTEQVEVQANAAQVETRNAGVGQVVENARVLEMPLNGRNVNELIALTGAAAPAPANGSGRNPFLPTTGVQGVSVGGGSSISLNYTLDGANHNNSFENTYLSFPFPDAMQEFKVETSATAVQNGVRPAGSVSLVTKSGTNEFHGDLFEFVRNGMFNARNAFATKRDTIKRNQFGGTVGGPIMKNKVFFFAGYQGTPIRQDPADVVTYVPTAAMVAGDFTALASPACNGGRQIPLKAPFVNNRVDPSLLSKAALNFQKLLPQTSDPCGKTIFGTPVKTDSHMAIGRIDYQKSDKNSIFGRYLLDSQFSPPPYTLSHNVLAAKQLGVDALTQAFSIGDTYLVNANVVNSLRLTANRWVGGRTGADYAGWPEMGVKAFSYNPKHLTATVSGGGFDISPGGVGPAKLAVFGGNDDLSIVHGNHQFAIGTQLSWWWINSYSDFYSYGRATFSGQTTGLPLADYMMGNVAQWTMGTPAPTLKRDKYAGAYFGDTWKARPRITFSYGVRWEPFFASINRDGSTTHFDINAFNKGIKSDKLIAAPPGMFFAGDPGVPGQSMMRDRWGNFSPRVGLAWDVNGDGKTSVRVSFGTFYDYPSSFFQVGLSNAPPTSQRNIISGVSLDNPWANYPGGDPFPMPFGKDWTRNTPWPLNAVVTAIDYDTKNSMISQWNLSVQRQLGSSWLVSASYLGTESAHLWALQQLNPAVYIPGNCSAGQLGLTVNGPCSTTANTNQRRVLALANSQYGQYFGTVNRIDSGAAGSYNGLILSIQRRAAKGVTLTGNYTFSHCISDNVLSNTGNSGNADGGYLNPQNRRFDRGNCQADTRQLFNVSAVAETPKFSNGTLRALGSNWRFSPLLKINSGQYSNFAAAGGIITSSDVALTAIAAQRVNQILPNPYGDKSYRNFLNPKAFALPAPGTLGNSGFNAIAGPGSWEFDAALSRSFQVRESQKVEFRAEAFNLTNSFRMDPTKLVNTLNSGSFGQVNGALDPRIMQFALKYFF